MSTFFRRLSRKWMFTLSKFLRISVSGADSQGLVACVTRHKLWSHEFQMAKEHVEYSLVGCVFFDTKCMITPCIIV